MLKNSIKNFGLALGVLANFSLSAENRNEFCDNKPLITKLEGLYSYGEDSLITFKGEKYPKIKFSDAFHEDLCFHLKDPGQADIIHKAFSYHILPYLPHNLLEPFSNSLLKVCTLFGSDHFSPESALLASIKEEREPLYNWMKQHQDKFKDFIAQANRPARSYPLKEKNSGVFTIVILTTSTSGGNHTVARAIDTFLSSLKGLRSIVVDVEDIAKETDLIMLATGAATYDGMYAKYFQQGNQGMDLLMMRDILCKQLGKYIPSCFGQRLKELITELNPDLILSTRSYSIDDVPLCTLGIPFRMVHCDYELSFFLMDLYGKVQPEMMKFWLPNNEPRIFRPLFEKAGRLDIYDEKDTVETVTKKIAAITQQPVELIQGQFELLGYPTCPEFRFIEDVGQLEQLRNKWGIAPGVIPILVSMGKNGVGVLENIFDELLTSPNQSFPIKYFFVCGRNIELQSQLERKKFQKIDQNFEVCGLLTPNEMNELMNICPLFITKPGGAVTSEALETGTHLLIMCSHPWEEANGSTIERLGLGHRTQASRPLSLQVNEQLKMIGNQKRSPYCAIPWKKLLLEHIQSINN